MDHPDGQAGAGSPTQREHEGRPDPVQLGVDDLVQVERVRLLHSRAGMALSITIFNAAIVAGVYWEIASAAVCSGWLAYVCAVAALRMVAIRAYARRSGDPAAARWWAHLYALGAGFNGIGWGAFAAVFLRSGSILHQTFLVFVVAGMAAGAAATNAISMPAVTAFAVPALLPVVVVLGAIGDGVHVAMAAMAVMFSLVVALVSRTGGQAMTEAIRLRFKNEALLAEQRRSQAQLVARDRLASIGTLAAGVAHEINNPLAYIKANLDLVAESLRRPCRTPDGCDPELTTMVDEAREGAERVRKIVRGLKTFSRADEEHRTVLDVRSVLETAISMATNEIKHRAGLVKRFERVPDVHADESRLVQVFTNLLVNAAQAIPEGQANRNVITIETRSDGRGRALVEVSDTGRGISKADLGRVFEPFFTTKPVGVGTGLGLSVCHGIVTSLGGEIGVESAMGRGTMFRVALPPAGADAGRLAVTPELESTEAVRGARVLVVDDDPLVGAAVRRALADDHEVAVVESGAAALAHISEGERYDVIFCDLMMPVMTGMELHAQVAALDERQAHRMVFATGGAFTPAARAFLDRVSHARLEKPFELRELRAMVRRFQGA